ncbi:MAG: hydrogenase maturation protease [Kribbellaceae bacterium]
MTAPVVIGVGNEYRRDDGVGPALVAALRRQPPPGVRLVVSDGEPAGLIEEWAGAPLAVVVDAVLCDPPAPGAVHRTELVASAGALRPAAASSHSLGIPDALRLGRALERVPDRLVVYAVEAQDVDFGTDLSGPVTTALPGLVDAVLAELAQPGAR